MCLGGALVSTWLSADMGLGSAAEYNVWHDDDGFQLPMGLKKNAFEPPKQSSATTEEMTGRLMGFWIALPGYKREGMKGVWLLFGLYCWVGIYYVIDPSMCSD